MTSCICYTWWSFIHSIVTVRYNKYIKNLVRDSSHPEAHLANSVTTDVSARYMSTAMKKEEYDIARDPHHRCCLSLPDRKWRPSRKVIADLRMLGCVVDRSSVTAYKIAHVMGIHFRAGEWGSFPRCGSVFTCKLKRQQNGGASSYYGRVIRFLQVDGYADNLVPRDLQW